MRRGSGQGFVLGMVAALLVLTAAAIIITNAKNGAQGTIKDLQSCSGFIGTLGGKEGACFSDTACTKALGKDGKERQQSGAVPSNGIYWQYIGKGYGCKDAYPLCCIQLGENQNPLSKKDLDNAGVSTPLLEEHYTLDRVGDAATPLQQDGVQHVSGAISGFSVSVTYSKKELLECETIVGAYAPDGTPLKIVPFPGCDAKVSFDAADIPTYAGSTPITYTIRTTMRENGQSRVFMVKQGASASYGIVGSFSTFNSKVIVP